MATTLPGHPLDGPGTPSETEFLVSAEEFATARDYISKHTHLTPVLTSSTLSGATGFDVRLKAELFQRTGSYKIRGALNQIRLLSPEQRARGVICSSAGNHAQGVALAAAINNVRAVVVMAENATPSKVQATRDYGAEVVLHGSIWDEANAHTLRLAEERGLTYLHPFDDLQLIAGQGTVGMELVEQVPDVDVVVVPIGGGGLISGVCQAVKQRRPQARVIGVESSDGPAMRDSVASGRLVTLESLDTVIDGLRVKRVGENTLEIVRRFVDEIVTVPDAAIFENVAWIMGRLKLVTEGAAASTVAALRARLVPAEPGQVVACILSGGNLNVDSLVGRSWN
jgi:threonine dehydratase